MKKEDIVVNDLPELMIAVFNDLNSITQPVWFRGQADKEWKLIPSIFRPGIVKRGVTIEIDLIKKFKQDATLLLDRMPKDVYEWLFIMRHHRVPTRIFDWTESLLVGAYFAVFERDANDGAIWALCPLELNKIRGLKESLPTFDEDSDLMSDYSPDNIAKTPYDDISPLAIIAPRNTQRMRSQLSVLTINHKSGKPIEELSDGKHVWRYVIPKEAKEKIKKQLEILGIGEVQLFPELEKIGQKLKEDCK